MPPKPYAFLPVPKQFETKPAIWHDGSNENLLSGELRCELTALTPLLVGWERRPLGGDSPPDPCSISAAYRKKLKNYFDLDLPDDKHLLRPLTYGNEDTSPVLLPGESIKGLLRHELGALLGAPMERVQEQTYSYRPNLGFPEGAPRVREPRLAKIVRTEAHTHNGITGSVPREVAVYRFAKRSDQTYHPNKDGDLLPDGAQPYYGGLAAGEELLAPSQRRPRRGEKPQRRPLLHTSVDLGELRLQFQSVEVSDAVVADYWRTIDHLTNVSDGHFSGRNPNLDEANSSEALASKLRAAAENAFHEGDIIWVELATDDAEPRIASFGWHYYYRWAYQDTIRTRHALQADGSYQPEPRAILWPAPEELECDEDGAPLGLTAVRRLFGYVEGIPGCRGIGKHEDRDRRDHVQLMGRLFVNAAIEQLGKRSPYERFLPPTLLRELGTPKPSAVEHYLQQHGTQARNSDCLPPDNATLQTYGDLRGEDAPGELAGRKFYLDRPPSDPHCPPWRECNKNKLASKLGTVAIDASTPDTRFRFTIRFRDLEPTELAAVMLALCPQQFATAAGAAEGDYCSKLGYARPLGWGSVRTEVAELHFIKEDRQGKPTLHHERNAVQWFASNLPPLDPQRRDAWLALHARRHADAGDYPRGDDGEIFTHHTELRKKHSQQRRIAAKRADRQ